MPFSLRPAKSAVNDGSVTLQSPVQSFWARSLTSALVYGSAISGRDGDVDGPVQPAAAAAEPGTCGQRLAPRRVSGGGGLGSVHHLGAEKLVKREMRPRRPLEAGADPIAAD